MSAITTWPGIAETWLDDRGRAAWIAATVLGLIFAWPLGLALLAYSIWSGRLFSRSRNWRKMRSVSKGYGFASTGNQAFDAYKAETLRRLEDEQQAFESFLKRLREAKDKAEFDEFMQDRAKDGKERVTVDAEAQ
ncbi:DUF2852 domain-containing protein [Brevirhabdus sp.]|uniref:DUF2852 domain-containing protein n=1 Tax=Brevirhabdus sp. TaxID=2004514 RepID=UPI004057EBA8